MPRSKPRKRKQQGEVMPPLNVSERVDSLLQEHLKYFPEKGELSDVEIEAWHRDLGKWPMQAIEWAFDCHRINGRYFPLYGQILDILVGWTPPDMAKRGCSIECRERHGKGYNENDMTKLWKLYAAKKDSLPNRPMTESEVNQLLDELDKWRGKPPEWRAA